MIIVLCADISDTNQYIELLSEAYQKGGHRTILGVDNFFHSNFKPDIVHIQWPEALFRWKSIADESAVITFKNRLSWFQRNNVTIVATFHNVKPHDHDSQLYKSVYKILYSNATIIVHHGKVSIDLLKKKIPESKNARHIVCPHGPYPFEHFDRGKARSFFGIPQQRFVLLNFGRQRPYKGNNFINHVFSKWEKDAFLFTVGPKSHSNNYPSQINKFFLAARRILTSYFCRIFPAALNHNLNLLQDISHNEIPLIMACSDVMFLGHTSGINSGLLSLAVSYKKPVVYPDIGNFKEQINGWQWGESYQKGNTASAIKALDRIWARLTTATSLPEKKNFNNKHWIQSNSWERHVQLIIDSILPIKFN